MDDVNVNSIDITHLPDHWRGIAKYNTQEAAEIYRKCADALELSWHEHAHDGEWRDNCKICRIERETVK